MSKEITEFNIVGDSITISTRELVADEQYEYTSKTVTLSAPDIASILAIVTPYLTA